MTGTSLPGGEGSFRRRQPRGQGALLEMRGSVRQWLLQKNTEPSLRFIKGRIVSVFDEEHQRGIFGDLLHEALSGVFQKIPCTLLVCREYFAVWQRGSDHSSPIVARCPSAGPQCLILVLSEEME